jgi:drug/metabolite transporter (DMT)-like permease
MEVVSKPLMGTVDPLVLTMWRFILGIAVLGIVMAVRGRKPVLVGKSIALLALMGLLNTFLSMSLLQLAVKNTTAARAATIFCSNPILVVLLASILRWEKLTGRRAVGLLLGLSGLILVTRVHTMSIDRGTVYALLASLTFAVYILTGRKASLGTDSVTVNLISFAFGITGLLLFLLIRGIDISPEPLFSHLPAFLFLGAGVSGLGYITFIMTIKRLGAGNASTIFLLKPALATALALILIKEPVTPQFVTGLILTGAGSWLVVGLKTQV